MFRFCEQSGNNTLLAALRALSRYSFATSRGLLRNCWMTLRVILRPALISEETTQGTNEIMRLENQCCSLGYPLWMTFLEVVDCSKYPT